MFLGMETGRIFIDKTKKETDYEGQKNFIEPLGSFVDTFISF